MLPPVVVGVQPVVDTVSSMIDVSESQLREHLATALSVQRWVNDVAADAPFADESELVASAERAGASLTEAEIDEALAHHPRIGESPVGEGSAQEFSRREQQASQLTDDPAEVKALAEGNATYEERFGRVFVVRAAGRSKAEIIAELERRLKLDDESEKREAGAQLVEIAVLRLRQTFGRTSAETGRSAETASPRDSEPLGA
jgi:2-oxo-4-hydroxy-4-carboxy-5-ureidoimidazoline decarboxylase